MQRYLVLPQTNRLTAVRVPRATLPGITFHCKMPLTTPDCNIKCQKYIYIFLTVTGHE